MVGLCVSIAPAPALQRWSWLFPMTGTRDDCPELGAYERLRTTAALGNLAGRDPVALAHAQTAQSHEVVADCLSHTTTLWLPVWAVGVAVAAAAVAWTVDRARARRAAA